MEGLPRASPQGVLGCWLGEYPGPSSMSKASWFGSLLMRGWFCLVLLYASLLLLRISQPGGVISDRRGGG
jgi:hypothetical protein